MRWTTLACGVAMRAVLPVLAACAATPSGFAAGTPAAPAATPPAAEAPSPAAGNHSVAAPVPTAAPTEATLPPAAASVPVSPPTPTAVPTLPAAATPPPTAAASLLPSTGVGWSELHYAAHKLFLTATSSVLVRGVPVASLAELDRRPPSGRPVPVPATGAVAVSVASKLPFGRSEDATIWLDPASGAALGGEINSLGDSPYHKLLRYLEGGLFTWRRAPRNAREAAAGPEDWSAHSDWLVTAADPAPPGVPITDSYALLYLVSAAHLDRRQGSALHIVTLDHGRYVDVTFTADGLRDRHARFSESWPGGQRRRDGDVLVRVVRGTAHVVGEKAGGEDVDLGFLGMRGTLTLDVEVGTGVPIAFSGRVQYLGTVTARLTGIVLTGPPATGDTTAPPPTPPLSPAP